MIINQENITFEIIDGSSLCITDDQTYPDECMVFEWVSLYDKGIYNPVCERHYSVSSEYEPWVTMPIADGTIQYTKIAVYPKEHFTSNSVGEIAYENQDDGSISLCQKTVEGWKLISLDDAYDAIFNNYKDDENADEAYYYTPIQLFLLGNIEKCLIHLQKQYICESLTNKCSVDSTKSRRDFMHSAVEVLRYLSFTENYEEAQRILDNVSECGFLCEDIYNKSTRCNCE